MPLPGCLCRANDAIFDRWYDPNASFIDPAGQLSPKLAFKGLAELFDPEPPSLKRFEVVESTRDRIKLEIETGYFIKAPVVGRIGPLPFKCTTVLSERYSSATDDTMVAHQIACYQENEWMVPWESLSYRA